MNFDLNSGIFTYEDRIIFVHSKDKPFISLIKKQDKIKSNRGSFSVKSTVLSQVLLKDVVIEDNKSNKLVLKFFSDENFVTMTFSTYKNGLRISDFVSNSKDYIEFNFKANPEEKLFGLGERFLKLNLKGEKVENLVSEHITLKPILAKAYPFMQKLGLSAKAEFSQIKTYCPMSIFTSSDKYLMYFDTYDYGVFDFKSDPNINKISFVKPPSSIHIFCGRNYFELSKKLNSILPNKQYIPNWVYEGMTLGIKGDLNTAVDKAEKMLELGACISGIWCENWSGYKETVAGKQVYWNWEYNKEIYNGLPQKIKELEKKGVNFVAYNNPFLLKDAPMYNDYKEKGFLIKNAKDNVYHIKTTTFPAGMIDLTNPKAFEYTKAIIIENMINIGIKGWMADFGEYLPMDCVLFSGENAAELHNKWPILWARCNREAIDESGRKDVFFFSRSGYNGSQKYSPIMWNGDQHVDFSLDYGMGSVIPASLSLSMSGNVLSHSDIAGYITFGKLLRDKELWCRWIMMNTFSPFMRSHATPRVNENVQFDYDEEIIEITKLYTNIHKLLKPYLKYVIETQGILGIPAMRPVFYNYPNEAFSYENDFVYMLGDDLYISPTIGKGKDEIAVSLPNDKWINLMTGEKIKELNTYVSTPVNRIAVFYRSESKYKDVFEKITNYIINFKGEQNEKSN